MEGWKGGKLEKSIREREKEGKWRDNKTTKREGNGRV